MHATWRQTCQLIERQVQVCKSCKAAVAPRWQSARQLIERQRDVVDAVQASYRIRAPSGRQAATILVVISWPADAR